MTAMPSGRRKNLIDGQRMPGPHRKHFNRTRYILIAAMLGGILLAPSTCSHVPFDVDRTITRFTDVVASGALHDGAQEITQSLDGASAFYPLVDGNDALGARLKLIQSAEKSLDLQYFLLKPDRAGDVISAALIEAAERGVRVRFLLDDIFTTASDRELALVDSHENIELRLFNPLSRRSTKAMNFVFDFGRVNRRMHNKSMIADGSVVVFGGRNIAEEYYQIETNAEFADFDMLAVGAIVPEIAGEFDLYWNDAFSVPVSAIYGEIEEEDLRTELKQMNEKAKQALADVYEHAVSSRYLAEILDGTTEPQRTEAALVNDPPDKLRVSVRKGADLRVLSAYMTERIKNSTKEVMIITPYFVPEPSDVQMYKDLAESGVRVRIVTNSLASTNHSYVHGGYALHRKALLGSGVELYEVRADAPEVLGQVPVGSDVKLTMHTKAAVFDRETIFVGSMNFDPRSIRINTEVGVFLSETDVVDDLMVSLEDRLKEYTYQVGVDDSGNLTWTWSGTGGVSVLNAEPGASFLDKFVAKIAQFLPIHGQF